jgi:hypothetical protein
MNTMEYGKIGRVECFKPYFKDQLIYMLRDGLSHINEDIATPKNDIHKRLLEQLANDYRLFIMYAERIPYCE